MCNRHEPKQAYLSGLTDEEVSTLTAPHRRPQETLPFATFKDVCMMNITRAAKGAIQSVEMPSGLAGTH
jgi:hypothetical protein